MFLYGFNVDYSVAATLRIVIPALWVRPPLANPIFNMASVRRILLAVGSEVLWLDRIMVITWDCLSHHRSSILRRVAKF